MKKREQEEKHDNHERWLLSYADFITLLMVFFVIMYSMSKVDQLKFYQLAQSLNAAFVGGTGDSGGGNQHTIIIPMDLPTWPPTTAETAATTTTADNATERPTTPVNPTAPPAMNTSDIEKAAQDLEMHNLMIIERQLAAYFVKENMNDSIMLHIDSRGLVVSLNATVLFDPGSADVKPDMASVLTGVGNIIDKLDNYIRVEGHTDNVPIGAGSKYVSNWDLSTARATNVVELFVNKVGIKPQKLVAAGYSEYKPIASNDTPEGRSKNRRVDIIILNSKYNDLEDQLNDVASMNRTPSQILQETSETTTENTDTTIPPT